MKSAIAAALALAAAASVHAQAVPAVPDLSYATPLEGSWRYAATVGGSEAIFSNASGAPQLWVGCIRATRRVTIAKPASAAAPFLNVWTSSLTRSAPSSFNPATGRLTIDLPALDGLLDALATSRGRIGFSVGADPALVLPPWPEAARVIEDCRV
jgi:hypothetical protein